jgi:hypothetical protein
MGFQRTLTLWLGLTIGGLWLSPATAWAQPGKPNQEQIAKEVPLEQLPAAIRDGVRRVLEQPTVFAHGPPEAFRAQPAFYCWLLDHPDRGVQMWRRLGAKCVTIVDRGNGYFGWTDGQGTDISWQTIHRSTNLRIWYAEGTARPGPLLPPVPLRAVVVLRYGEAPSVPLYAKKNEKDSRTLMIHQADLFLQTDSQAAALVAKLVGSSAPRLAEHCVSQMEMFFSALAWYVNRHPDRAEALLSEMLPPSWNFPESNSNPKAIDPFPATAVPKGN